MDFAIAIPQQILLLFLVIPVVADHLLLLMVAINLVASSSSFAVRDSSAGEVLIVVLHPNISLRI